MSKTTVSFFELEKWEEKYLADHLAKINNLSFNFFPGPLNLRRLKKVTSTDILVTFIYSNINSEIIEQLPKLKFIATMSTGFDHIDLAGCRKRKIMVSNVPYYGENTVAEHTFALILALSRRLADSLARTRTGNFSLAGLRGFDLKNKILGIIGLGHIGQQVARMARGFEMKIVVYDPKQDQKLAESLHFKYAGLAALLKQSDIISLHAPYNQQTHHLINKQNIGLIKPGAYLINTARGGLVETEALLLALKKKIVAGAGLDVLEEECFIKEEKELLAKQFQKKCDLKTVLQNHLLIQDNRVLVTPHNAFNSREALGRILDTTIANIKSWLAGRPVNLVK